jgi:hypothetical protein
MVALADRLEKFQHVLESARQADNKTISVWSDDPRIVAEAVNALRSAARNGPDVGYVAGFEACREAAKNVADRAAERDEEYAYKYPDEARKFDQRAHRAKTISDAIAALPAAATASAGWQPIETAPKDGTPLLLGWPTFHPLVGHCEDGLWGELDSDFGFEPFENTPTHWMPLPAAPTITRKSKNEEPRS